MTAYEAAISGLIPLAEDAANADVLKSDYVCRGDYKADWDKVYLLEMQRLAREAGLR